MSRERRNERLVSTLNLGGEGIEYGPLNRPVVEKAHRVKYVDHASRADLVRHYQSDAAVPVADIREVDIATGGRPILDFIKPSSVDYVVCSHVAEHVPDLVGWLSDNLKILRPGGRIAMAYPDKRFTFDIGRKKSDLAGLAAAHIERRHKPTIDQIADHFLNVRKVDLRLIWETDATPDAFPLMYDRKTVFDLMRSAAKTGRYVDCHCWVFDDAACVRMLRGIAQAFVLPMKVIDFQPTQHYSHEFLVTIEKAV